MTLAGLNESITTRLCEALGNREGRATARLIMEDVLHADPVRIFTRGDYCPEPETIAKVNRIVEKILSGMPPQYAVGSARFMGMDLEVTGATLIPRPETAGLIDLIVSQYQGIRDLKILDVGTGSGCIAIALARSLPFARVTAIDISSDAIEVARRNAKRLSAKIDFEQADIFASEPPSAPYLDIIVSNPPYIATFEKDMMESRVLDYEPATALFVEDDDPLIFYRAIARYGRGALLGGGRLYFEINPLFAKDLAAMLQSEGYDDIDITRDFTGAERYASAQLPAR